MNLSDLKKLISEEGKVVVVSDNDDVALVAMSFAEYQKMKSHQRQEEIPFEPTEPAFDVDDIVGPVMEEFDEMPQPAIAEPRQANENIVSPAEPEMAMPITQEPALPEIAQPVAAQEKELTVEDLPF